MLHLTEKNFTVETKRGPLPNVVMFYAVWCGKCAMMKPLVEEIEKKYRKKIRFCEVDIDESPYLPRTMKQISSRPSSFSRMANSLAICRES